jgi:hypothetical protein
MLSPRRASVWHGTGRSVRPKSESVAVLSGVERYMHRIQPPTGTTGMLRACLFSTRRLARSTQPRAQARLDRHPLMSAVVRCMAWFAGNLAYWRRSPSCECWCVCAHCCALLLRAPTHMAHAHARRRAGPPRRIASARASYV